MSTYTILLGSVLLALASQTFAQDPQAVCKSPITPSASFDMRTKSLPDRFKSIPELAPRLQLAASTLWTCEKGEDKKKCCENIPLTLLLDQTGAVCAVVFPYSKLAIKRDNGNFKPKISWVVAQASSSPTHVFGSAGIEIIPIVGSTPPVDTSGLEKCRYAGSSDNFRCKGNAKNKAQADHIANVYPVGHLDEPEFRCRNIDPTISNTN